MSDHHPRVRNYGIDLFRLVLMLNVVVIHMLLYGIDMNNLSGNVWRTSRLLHVASISAVDCFALVSGYVGYHEYDNKSHYSKYLHFWAQVFFYSVSITFVGRLCTNNVDRSALFKSFIPIGSGHWWYATAYTGLYFLMPWLNKLIRSCSRKELNQLVLTILSVFSVYGILTHRLDPFLLNEGHSVLWLVIMYITGAWLKKNEICSVLERKHWLSLSIIGIIIVWLLYILLPVGRASLIRYISVATVIIAICRVSYYSSLQIDKKWNPAIKLFSPAAFGVYLIHEHHFVRENVIGTLFTRLRNINNPVVFMACVLGSCLLVFVVCLLIEMFRLRLFRYLHINEAVNSISKSLENLYLKICMRHSLEL